MGILGFGHRHISPETLTEFLDGRLRSRSQTRERLERVMSTCADCREEMESLRATVAALRQLPVFAPRRSFVMAAPPVASPAVVYQRRAVSPFRVPQWAYAGAASVAALVLAVLVSMDASGLVAPSGAAAPGAAALKSAATASPSPESESPVQDADAQAGAQAAARVESFSQPADELVVQVQKESEVEAPAAAAAAEAPPATAPSAAAMEGPAPLAAETQAQGAAPEAAPEAARVEAAPAADSQTQAAVAELQAQALVEAGSQSDTSTESTGEKYGDATSEKTPALSAAQSESVAVAVAKVGQSDETAPLERAGQPSAIEEATPIFLQKASDAQPETVETLPSRDAAPATEAPNSGAAASTIADEAPPAEDDRIAIETPGTPLVWRLLEALAAIMLLSLTAVFYLSRRASRRF